jgi:hypothetical protein
MKSQYLVQPRAHQYIPTPKFTITTKFMEDKRSKIQGICYYPKCRKDANCNCEICLASINATLDLMPNSLTVSTEIYDQQA